MVAVLALVFQQIRVYEQTKNIELRTETKLKIFYILQDGELSLEEIMTRLRNQNPTSKFDDIETRKALYEMLHDETVRLMQDKRYRPRLRAAQPTPSEYKS